MKSLISLLLVVWLIVGAVAAWQRDYFTEGREPSCKNLSNTVLTVLAGPLNYTGVNPKVDCKNVPQPSE